MQVAQSIGNGNSEFRQTRYHHDYTSLQIIILALLLSYTACQDANTTTVVYYVTTTASGQDCPSTHQQYCNPLSYYCSLAPDQWSPNTTLIFLPGVHDCGTRNFTVKGVNQLVLNGQSTMNDSSVIKCNQMVFNNISSLSIARLKLVLESSFTTEYSALRLEGITHTILLENVLVSNAIGSVILMEHSGSILINDAYIFGTWTCLYIVSSGSSSFGSNSNLNHVNLTNITLIIVIVLVLLLQIHITLT